MSGYSVLSVSYNYLPLPIIDEELPERGWKTLTLLRIFRPPEAPPVASLNAPWIAPLAKLVPMLENASPTGLSIGPSLGNFIPLRLCNRTARGLRDMFRVVAFFRCNTVC